MIKRNLKLWLLSAVMMTSVFGCAKSEIPSETETTIVSTEATVASSESETETEAETTKADVIEGGFQVDGTKLLDANGEEFVFRGINEAHKWFIDQDGVSLKAIADYGCNSVRIVCGSGIKNSKDSQIVLKTLIRVAKNLNLIPILEVHDGTGDNDIATLESIADYWIENKDVLIGEEAYVILNIANEWYGSWNKTEIWAEGYKKVIPKLREAGIKNTIMVDAAGWGQLSKSIADYGQEIFDADPLKNTMFSIHMYGAAGKNEKTITTGIKGATDLGLCVCVGEFGYKHSDGDVDEAFIMKYCTENNIGYLGWSWKGNGGGVEYLDIAEDWEGKNLSPEWGEVLINGENGIRKTSKLCSVFK